MTLDSKVIISETLFLQEVDDETILLDTVSQEYFSLNEAASMIWKILSLNKNLNEVKKEILSNYDIDEKQVEDDILKFVKQLKEKDFVILD